MFLCTGQKGKHCEGCPASLKSKKQQGNGPLFKPPFASSGKEHKPLECARGVLLTQEQQGSFQDNSSNITLSDKQLQVREQLPNDIHLHHLS